MSIELPYIPLSTSEKQALVGSSGTPSSTNKYVTNSDTRFGLTANTTVNLDSSMTSAQIQALINAQPKNLNGYSLIFQFADGTYTLDTALLFQFFVGGYVYLKGKSSETTASITKSVTLNFSSSHGIRFFSNNCSIYVWYLAVNTTTVNGDCIQVNTAPYAEIFACGCTMYGTTAANLGTVFANCFGAVSTTVFKHGSAAIKADGVCQIRSNINSSDAEDKPTYGLWASEGGIILKHDANQPSGGTADELKNFGGQILA